MTGSSSHSSGSERRLAAIMFTDIVGYTALMARDEEAGRRARRRHEEVVRPLVERYGGQWIERTGDETLSSFPSALDAVNCALAAQAALDGEPELQLRIGIHQGDVTFDADGVSGDGVNVAARVRPLAEPGGICITGDVHHSVRGRPGLEFEALGEQDFKNVDHPVVVFAVSGTAEAPRAVADRGSESTPGARRGVGWVAAAVLLIAAAAGWWLYRPAGDLAPIRSIAVLPLENLSGDPGQSYIAAGMHEALIGSLARIGSEVEVVSRTSVTQYEGTHKTVPEIAAELGVDGIIEGSALREGDQVRITLQLIDARRDSHLWAQSYDREFGSALALQREIAREVAGQIQIALAPAREQLLMGSRAVGPEALEAYLHARSTTGTLTLAPTWAPIAIAHVERAVELDPGFAEAWALLAGMRVILALTIDDTAWSSAREAAETALELDETLGNAHSVLSMIRLRHDWDFSGADRALARALQLSPNDPTVLETHTWHLLHRGKLEEGLTVSERLVRIAPFDIYWRSQHFRHLAAAREYERALEQVERIRELDPSFVDLGIGTVYAMLGRFEEAYSAYVAFFERCGSPCDTAHTAMMRGWDEGGWEGALLALLELQIAAERVDPILVASLYTMLGEKDGAFAWLERAYREHHSNLVASLTGPGFDSLRSDPRFHDLLHTRIGFPES